MRPPLIIRLIVQQVQCPGERSQCIAPDAGLSLCFRHDAVFIKDDA